MRIIASIILLVLGVSACAPVNTPMRMGPDGKPVPVVYRIGPGDAPRVRQRMQDGINTMRAQNGLGPLTGNLELASAAATHAQDMSFQKRPWHWGSDGASPMQRTQRAGYQGTFVGELISETFETEVETVNAWLTEPETRQVVLDPDATELGVGWHQDANGKLWWDVVLGKSRGIDALAPR